GVLREIERVCAGARVVGLEPILQAAAIARRRVRCPVLVGTIQDRPLHTSFRLIGLFDVLEHIPDDAGALRDLRSLLEPGGRIVLTVPANPRLWSDFDTASRHCRRYTATSLAVTVRAAGLRITYATHFMVLPQLAMHLRRRAPALERAHPSTTIAHELRIIAVVNELAFLSLLPESMAVRLGLRIPTGASLLAVLDRE
ncbi:MAG: class I SAM-dependent methyltransferase, partial [Candidatus Dormibacteria bacterium]